MASDDVHLTDLALIQQFSLAVRSATAPRSEVIAALEADLAFLTRGARRRVVGPATAASPAASTAAPTAEPAPAPTAEAADGPDGPMTAPGPASAARVRRTSPPRAALKAPGAPVITKPVASKPAAAKTAAAKPVAGTPAARKPAAPRAPRA